MSLGSGTMSSGWVVVWCHQMVAPDAAHVRFFYSKVQGGFVAHCAQGNNLGWPRYTVVDGC